MGFTVEATLIIRNATVAILLAVTTLLAVCLEGFTVTGSAVVVVVGMEVVVGVGVVVFVTCSRRLPGAWSMLCADVGAWRRSEPLATSAAGRVSSSACRKPRVWFRA